LQKPSAATAKPTPVTTGAPGVAGAPPRSAASQAHYHQRNCCVAGKYCPADQTYVPGVDPSSCRA
jgi:hypothetical protein